jgi:spore maturation protein CgeB
MNILVVGLTITSSWGNGHATTYRGLLRALAARGHRITFAEQYAEWYAANRDLYEPDFAEVLVYPSWDDIEPELTRRAAAAEVIVVGSFCPEGRRVVDWALGQARRTGAIAAFYDIDTPVTLQALAQHGETFYLRADQVSAFDVVFSFAGGRAIEELQQRWGARLVRPLYCAADPTYYYPAKPDPRFMADYSYMGTYAADRQPAVERLFLDVARRCPDRSFVLAGAQYPPGTLDLPNLRHYVHVPPPDHPAFFSSSRLTLKVTRRAMVTYGYSPSVTLFEAAACGACIVSDVWEGLEQFFTPGEEILPARATDDVMQYLALPDRALQRIGAAARRRVLREHTYAIRAVEFEQAVAAAQAEKVPASRGIDRAQQDKAR